MTNRTDEITNDQVQWATRQIRTFRSVLAGADAEGDDFADDIHEAGLNIEFGGMGWVLDFDGKEWTGAQGRFENTAIGQRLIVAEDHEQVRLGAADATPQEVVAALKSATEAWLSDRHR